VVPALTNQTSESERERPGSQKSPRLRCRGRDPSQAEPGSDDWFAKRCSVA